MRSQTPSNPDIKRELSEHLLAMSPRAFELFAGDLLVYTGLEKVAVTRYIGDGGIDAEGDLIAGEFRFPVGVQVKRYRRNVRRVDIEQFIGALTGRFSQGVFITTASYAKTALSKASHSVPRILTLNGNQIIAIMLRNKLGITPFPNDPLRYAVNSDYFSDFELQKELFSHKVSESRQDYDASSSEQKPVELKPEEDLISLTTLAYALRVDHTTVRSWLEHGKLQADAQQKAGERSNYYFRRDRIEEIRVQFNVGNAPSSSAEWRQEFLDFAKSRQLTKSYKPVLLKAILKVVDREGIASIDDVVREFRAFYIQRYEAGQPVEFGVRLLKDPATASDSEIKQLIVKYPLNRFIIKKYIEYSSRSDEIRIAPQLWQELRYYEVLDVLTSAEDQIEYYYARHTGDT
jgi:hypothetical protein